jgi:hypothetical protein
MLRLHTIATVIIRGNFFPGSSHTGTRTRLNHIQYSTQESLPIIRPPSGLYPCTPKYTNKSTRNSFTVVCSSSPLIEEINLNTHSTTSYGTHPHPYFRYMLNFTSLTTIPTLAKIATEVQSYKLFIITDGSYDYMTKQGSHAIAITNNKKVLWLGAGPCLGNDISINLKRAELCGLASALYLALWICLDQEIHYGSITFLCDSKRAVNTLRDISQCLPLKHPTNDIDLALECRTIIKKLPIKAYFNWLPGHKKADDVLSKIQRDVHTAAKSHNKIISPSPTVLPPSYKIAIGLQSKIIPTNLKGIVNQVAHEMEIRNMIMKNIGWTLHQFHDVDWRAHQKAFCSIGRFRQISMCKIIHGLLCTNDKQKRYYGKTDLCPCCGSSTETMNHMLCCPSQYATEFRVKAQQELELELKQINTPDPILSAILCGASQFEELTNGNKPDRPTTRGSILPTDVLATHCIATQGALGWDQFLRGRSRSLGGNSSPIPDTQRTHMVRSGQKN